MSFRRSHYQCIRIFGLALILVTAFSSEQVMANSRSCPAQLIENNCDDRVDGIDLNCDHRIDIPLRDNRLKIGRLLGPIPIQLKDSKLRVEEGTLLVAENRRTCEVGGSFEPRRVISIGYKRFRTSSSRPQTPVFNLPGGPGAAPFTKDSLKNISDLDLFKGVLASRDVVLVEQRGMGSFLSSINLRVPALACPGSYDLSLNEPLSVEKMVSGARNLSATCVAHLEKQGVDISAYNIFEMADDVNDLRRALGYEKISLLAGSFGSQHALAVLRSHNEIVERAVFTGTEGITKTFKLPSTIESKLELLSQMAALDPMLSRIIAQTGAPDFLTLLRIVANQLEAQPVTVAIPDPQNPRKTVEVTIGKTDAQAVFTANLSSTEFLTQLPLLTLATLSGDYSLLAAASVQQRINQKILPVNYATDCATGVSNSRRAQIEAESPRTTLGNLINLPKIGTCDVWGKQFSDGLRQEPASDIPILFASAELDPRTPARDVQEFLNQGLFPNGQSILIKGVSHDFNLDAQSSVIFADTVADFFNGDFVGLDVIKSTFNFVVAPPQ